jgi:large subunit ribosomal protein L10
MNPFELYSFIKKNKGDAPAKEGMIAPNDIIVPAGDTGLPPGPALSDLKGAGLKVKVEGPSIQVTEDKVVTKAGDVVNAAVAGTLSKLDIKPIKIGMKLTAALENGQIFLPEVLDIDTEQVFNNFVNAHRNSFLLTLEIGYFTTINMPLLITKAAGESKAVALEANILTKETVGNVLAKASAQAGVLKAKVPAAPPAEEKKEEPAAEKPEEKAEAKPEEKAEEKAEEKPAEEKPVEEAKPEEAKEEAKPEEKKEAEAPAEEEKE